MTRGSPQICVTSYHQHKHLKVIIIKEYITKNDNKLVFVLVNRKSQLEIFNNQFTKHEFLWFLEANTIYRNMLAKLGSLHR